ncbi:hypothetical protein ACNGWL_004925, partial [Escherichia coli]
ETNILNNIQPINLIKLIGLIKKTRMVRHTGKPESKSLIITLWLLHLSNDIISWNCITLQILPTYFN